MNNKFTAAWDFGIKDSPIVLIGPNGEVINPHIEPDDMCRECDGEGWVTNAYDQEESCKRCKGAGYVEVED